MHIPEHLSAALNNSITKKGLFFKTNDMKKLFKLMLKNNVLRAPEGADGADGGGAAKTDPAPDLATKVDTLSALVEKLVSGKKDPEPAPSDADKVRADLEAKARKDAETAQMQDAIKFNLGVGDFVAKNKDLLGRLAEGLVQEVNKKQFSDEVRKACALKKNLLEDFFMLQENIDAAPEELKPRIMAFKALADDEKEKQAARFWDTLTLTLGHKKLAAQVAAAKRARSGQFEETNDLVKQYNDRVFAKRAHYLGEKGEDK